MPLLVDATEEKNFDVRMVERNLTRGRVTSDDVEKLVKKLPDDSENAQWVNPVDLPDDIK